MDKNREELIEYLNENYKRMLKMASSFVGKYNAPDLVSEALLTIYNRKKPLGDIRNKFVYFYVIFKNLAFSKSSTYHKLIESSKFDKEINERIDLPIEVESSNIQYSIFEDILEIVETLKTNKEIDWYQYKLFHLFYNNETLHDLENLTNKDLFYKRKMSYRKLQNEIGIDYQSIRNSVIQVINLIKEKLNNKTYEDFFEEYTYTYKINN